MMNNFDGPSRLDVKASRIDLNGDLVAAGYDSNQEGGFVLFVGVSVPRRNSIDLRFQSTESGRDATEYFEAARSNGHRSPQAVEHLPRQVGFGVCVDVAKGAPEADVNSRELAGVLAGVLKNSPLRTCFDAGRDAFTAPVGVVDPRGPIIFGEMRVAGPSFHVGLLAKLPFRQVARNSTAFRPHSGKAMVPVEARLWFNSRHSRLPLATIYNNAKAGLVRSVGGGSSPAQ